MKYIWLSIVFGLLFLTRSSVQQRNRGQHKYNFTGKKPVVIQHRTQDAVNYYDHENVR